MDRWWLRLFVRLILVTVINANSDNIRTINVQQDERVRLECTVSSKIDAEEATWMRIRPPHNPDILTYRDSVVYAPDRIQLEQRRLSSSITANGSFVDTHFLTLTILRPSIDDEGRYFCSRGKNVFAEYDLLVTVPPQFNDENGFNPQRSVIEGSTLQLSCSAYGRPRPSISWYYRTADGKHVLLGDGTDCQETVCELRLGNYTRHDPKSIECIADNGKSTRISKIFNVEVLYPPKLTTNVRTLTGTKSIDVLLHCSSVSHPPATIVWLDDNRQEIETHRMYTIKTRDQSSRLSFTVPSENHSTVLYYCRSNNSIGTAERLINISDFLQFESVSKSEPMSATIEHVMPSSKKQKSVGLTRARFKPTSTTRSIISTTKITSSSNSQMIPLSSTFLHIFSVTYVVRFVIYRF